MSTELIPSSTLSYDREALIRELKYTFIVDKVATHMSEFICGMGMLINGMLIYMIFRKTPPAMKSYAVLLLNFAFSDFFTSLASLFACQKTVFSGISLTYIFHGPCKYIAPWLCYFCHCFVCHAMAHSQWILLISFCYRYLVLVSVTPSTKGMILLTLGFYSMSFVTFAFYFMDRGDSAELLKIMSDLHPYYHYDDQKIWGELAVSGNAEIITTYSVIAIFYMTFPCVPIYIFIHFFRKKTLKILADAALNMSESTKKSHSKLIQALTIQALIPIFWLVASGVFTLAEFGFISGPIPENFTFRLMEFIPTTSPIVAFVYIGPYRDGLLAIFAKFGLYKKKGNKVKSEKSSKPSQSKI